MKLKLKGADISQCVIEATWSGDSKQAARKLDVTLLQDDRDSTLPILDIDCGYDIEFADDLGNLRGIFTVIDVERDRARATVKISCHDKLFTLNRSKTTRKFTDALPEDIARQICSEMGVKAGNIAATGIPVSFIANEKTGYQIIQGAYYEAHKKNSKSYQQLMRGNLLDVIEKGSTIAFKLDSRYNMTDSIYKESIANLVNRVLVVDDKGNTLDTIDDGESQAKYPRYQETYREQKGKDTGDGARDKLTKPKREGHVTALGDYRALTGYSVQVRDSLFLGKFYITSDSHTFKAGQHVMKLKLEFENTMDKSDELPQGS